MTRRRCLPRIRKNHRSRWAPGRICPRTPLLRPPVGSWAQARIRRAPQCRKPRRRHSRHMTPGRHNRPEPCHNWHFRRHRGMPVQRCAADMLAARTRRECHPRRSSHQAANCTSTRRWYRCTRRALRSRRMPCRTALRMPPPHPPARMRTLRLRIHRARRHPRRPLQRDTPTRWPRSPPGHCSRHPSHHRCPCMPVRPSTGCRWPLPPAPHNGCCPRRCRTPGCPRRYLQGLCSPERHHTHPPPHRIPRPVARRWPARTPVCRRTCWVVQRRQSPRIPGLACTRLRPSRPHS